jgi:octaprenyl-diphosphate synthase
MKDLFAYFDRELPRINAFLEQETRKLDGLVREVAAHVLLAGGKRIRPVLTILAARALGYEAGDVHPLACALEMLHSATLIHDDVLDGAELRRGRPAAHLVFGLNETILAGDVLLALSNRIGASYGKPRISFLLAEGIMATAEGEILELGLAAAPTADRETYLQVIIGKTARLIETCCRCGAALACADRPAEDAAGEFGLNLGIAFQLVDDALDYSSAPDDTGKPLGGDLREGKVTLPLIFLLEEMPQAGQTAFLARLKTDGLAAPECGDVVRRVRERGFDAKTREVAAAYIAKAREGLARLPGRPETRILDQAAEFVLTRRK